VELAALAPELEFDAPAAHLHVPVAHGGEPERIVLFRVALVADADAGALQQLHDERQHLAARQSRKPQVGAHLAANARQGVRELGEKLELVGISQLAPTRVVAVLLAALRVAPCRLQVAALVAADPDIRPCRRDGKRLDALDRLRVADACAVAIQVLEAFTAVPARVALLAVAGIAQPAHGGGPSCAFRPCGRHRRRTPVGKG